MSSPPGEVALVLHTHVPWLAGHGEWPVGEEWLFQVWGQSWYPVTRLLVRLGSEGHRDILTLGVSPLVAWQVAQPRLRAGVGAWLAGHMWQAEEQRTATAHLDAEVAALGPFYWRHYADLLAVHDQIEAAGGLLTVWADLAARGVIELLGGPATHPCLALQPDGRYVDAQLATGLAAHARWAGHSPRGIWAPEMSYRPRGTVADVTTAVDSAGTPARLTGDHAGLEGHYARHGISHFLVDATAVAHAASGSRNRLPDGVLAGDLDVAAFPHDRQFAARVSSPGGYPRDPWYRDFFATGWLGVHPSWRVTDPDGSPDGKAIYDAAAADRTVRRHVHDFHAALRAHLRDRPGSVTVAAFDTELFGHWWFEGPRWLDGVLRDVAADPTLTTTTLARRMATRPPTRRLDLRESSWGAGGGHGSWVAPPTRATWAAVVSAQARLQPWLDRRLGPDETDLRDQAIREIAALQCSDWTFMLVHDRAAEYAAQRLDGHRSRFDALVTALESGAADPAALADSRRLTPAPPDVSAFLGDRRPGLAP